MAKYAIFDKNGLPEAFYDPQIHKQIPPEAIQITDEQWREFINNQGKRKWDFETKQVVEFNPEDLLSIDELKQTKIETLKTLFVSLILQTDYIYLKAQDLGVDVATLYPNKLQWRNDLRAWYEKKKETINQATTKEELQDINLDDYPPMPEEN